MPKLPPAGITATPLPLIVPPVQDTVLAVTVPLPPKVPQELIVSPDVLAVPLTYTVPPSIWSVPAPSRVDPGPNV